MYSPWYSANGRGNEETRKKGGSGVNGKETERKMVVGREGRVPEGIGNVSPTFRKVWKTSVRRFGKYRKRKPGVPESMENVSPAFREVL